MEGRKLEPLWRVGKGWACMSRGRGWAWVGEGRGHWGGRGRGCEFERRVKISARSRTEGGITCRWIR